MEKEIFDNITDYIFSTQSLVDRVNRMFSVNNNLFNLEGDITYLIKRIDRVELEQTKLITNPNFKTLDVNLKSAITNYMCSVQVLIDILELRKSYDIEFTIKKVEKYEDNLTIILKNSLKDREMNQFINKWLPIFENTKIPTILLKEFQNECKNHNFKLIEVLSKMLKIHTNNKYWGDVVGY